MQKFFNQFHFSTSQIECKLSGEEERVLYNDQELRKKIEETRQKMYEAYEHNPDDPQVLTISQDLDVLLNKYNQAVKNTQNVK
ncbi:hypothetical protein CFK37_08850 [Virgibacillus phasianinus]|uniref:Aspartyl-phosphate phosphatase Spo0E family protein n=2 Tax=Virgibacillus phasianinus TaxID=2017483 RepID=A0A220U880_9BACI|nr:hypothetical protein CFK37_08850 [Virgibacillus phasianinus]